jgi:hypothetical protein
MLSFPPAPALDDIYAYLGRSWRWDGIAWSAQTGPTPTDLALAEFQLVSAASGAEVILGPFDCDEVAIHVEDVSSTGGATQGMEMYFSTDGVAYTLWGEVATHTSGAQAHNQVLIVRGLRTGRMHMVYGDSSVNDPPLNALSVGFSVARPAAQVTHLKFSWTALADFDGGAFRSLTPGGV